MSTVREDTSGFADDSRDEILTGAEPIFHSKPSLTGQFPQGKPPHTDAHRASPSRKGGLTGCRRGVANSTGYLHRESSSVQHDEEREAEHAERPEAEGLPGRRLIR